MSATSLVYWNAQLGKTQPRKVMFRYNITGAKALSEMIVGQPVLYGFDDTDFGADAAARQTAINDHLGTTDEFDDLAFDSTSLGLDAFGFVIAMQGQAKEVLQAKVRYFDSAGAQQAEVNIVEGTLANSSLTNGLLLGSEGNIAGRAILTGLDAEASGSVEIEIEWVSK